MRLTWYDINVNIEKIASSCSKQFHAGAKAKSPTLQNLPASCMVLQDLKLKACATGLQLCQPCLCSHMRQNDSSRGTARITQV
jgi:hypothetical protein